MEGQEQNINSGTNMVQGNPPQDSGRIMETLKKPIISSTHPNKARMVVYILALVVSVGLALVIGYSYGLTNADTKKVEEVVVDRTRKNGSDLANDMDLNSGRDIEKVSPTPVGKKESNDMERNPVIGTTKIPGEMNKLFLNKEKNIFVEYPNGWVPNIEFNMPVTIPPDTGWRVPTNRGFDSFGVYFTKNVNGEELKFGYSLKYLVVFGTEMYCEPKTKIKPYLLESTYNGATDFGWGYREETYRSGWDFEFYRYTPNPPGCLNGLESGEIGTVPFEGNLDILYSGPRDLIEEEITPFLKSLKPGDFGNFGDSDTLDYFWINLVKVDN